MKNTKYSVEFKVNVVEMYKESGKSQELVTL